MELRKCPSCRDLVGAESIVCPRCGVNFRSALIRKIVLRSLSVMLLAWLVGRFVFKLF
jgi:uncharacterized paraquat-inducible protein A